MKDFEKWHPAITIEIVLAALVWITVFAYEFIANFFLRYAKTPLAYYYVAITVTIGLALVVPLLGKKPLVDDIKEICWYDVLVQFIGLASSLYHQSEQFYWILSQFILVLKMARVSWPLLAVNNGLPLNWPTFGMLGLIRQWRTGGGAVKMPLAERNKVYRLFPLWGICAFGMQQAAVFAAVPVTSIATVIFTVAYTRRLTLKLEARENEAILALQTASDAKAETAIATERLRNHEAIEAKNVELIAKNAEVERQAAELADKNELLRHQAEDLKSKHALLEQQAAELATKHAQLEQQATELASKNTQLEALSAERAAMMADLAERNSSLRDAAHDFKIPLLELAAQVDLAQGFVTDEAQGALLNGLEMGLEELRSMMGDIIEQAKVSTELTATPIQRLAIPDLAGFFHERFYKMAEKRGVWFAIREDDFFISCNEMILRRIITNLTNNAIMYNESGTEVTLSFRRSDKAAYIRVYNTGPGILDANGTDRAANFTRLIEKIKLRRQPITPNATASLQGHGLGLQIVQRLCQELGTTITMRSLPGLVTVFRFKVPLAQ